MLFILLFIPGDYAGPCFIGFAIGESLGAAALRIAGGIFTKIADIGADLMKIVFKIKEDDARNPGVIADCTGDNAGDSVGPSADGFETLWRDGRCFDHFHPAGREGSTDQVQLLVWIFVMHHDAGCECAGVLHQWRDRESKVRQRGQDEFRASAHITGLDYVDCFDRRDLHRFVADHPQSRRRHNAVVEAGVHHLLRNLGGSGNS
jgi:hypothetical protein